MMHGTPFRKIARQHAPLAAALQQVQNGTERLIQVHCPRAGFLTGIVLSRSSLDWLKLFATDIAFSCSHYAARSEALNLRHPDGN